VQGGNGPTPALRANAETEGLQAQPLDSEACIVQGRFVALHCL
jgi:hypothetical protein